MVWFDRTGNRVGTVDEPDFRYNVFISPDGKRVASERRDASGNYDIWVFDSLRGTSSRLTNDPAVDGAPVWSPDGNRILFFSTRTGKPQIYQTSSSDGANEKRLQQSQLQQSVSDWSRDGRFIVYMEAHPETRRDIWLRALTGGSQPLPLVRTRFDEDHGRLSPDGKWIAYESDESHRNEVYLRRFRAVGGPGRERPGRLLVSTQGGMEPRWRRDGRELYYLSPTGT